MSTVPLRFNEKLKSLLTSELFPAQPHLLVALSGGMDSTLLLHLLRFSATRPLILSAAHFDHRMRPESAGDASWCRGLCAAWGVRLVEGRAEHMLRGEEEARSSRYAFLGAARRDLEAEWILTAHHADDQAETVLFRILRGTGLSGLRGIPERSSSGLMRPLLGFWREELREYACSAGIRWREDASNAGDGAARNRLRNTIIPQIERDVAPGARRSLVRLAELASESEASWERQVREISPRLVFETDGAFLVARREIARYDPEIGARLIRDVLRRLQSVPDRIGTRKILQFITDAASGRVKMLRGGVRILIEHDDARFSMSSPEAPQNCDWILERPPEFGPALGALVVGGRSYEINASVERAEPGTTVQGAWSFAAPLSDLSFPLTLRARRQGDRIRLAAGSRSVKKLLIDRRVAGSHRPAVPVLTDGKETVLWVSGVASADLRTAAAGELVLNLVLRK